MQGSKPRKVAVIAFACEPGRGSEPGAGWEWTKAIAEHSDVTVYTRAVSPNLETAANQTQNNVDSAPTGAKVVRISTLLDKVPSLRKITYLHYAAFMLCIWKTLRTSTEYDLVHHVTYASDWLPTVVPRRAKLVWGPVGGASYTPRQLTHYLGRRDRLSDSIRRYLSTFLRETLTKNTIRSADVTLAQNKDTERQLKRLGARNVQVFPNVVVPQRAVVRRREREPEEPFVAVWAGRPLAWKGGEIALRALAKECSGEASNWVLECYTAGPDFGNMEASVMSLGVSERVSFHAQTSQAEFLTALEAADALLYPSLHDSAGWVVAEAVSAGIPIICFNLGGPPEIAGSNMLPIDLDDPEPSIRRALQEVSKRRGSFRKYDWGRDRIVKATSAIYDEILAEPSRIDE